MIKAVIVEDDPVAQEYLKKLLDIYPGISIAGIASGVKDGADIIARTSPHLLFLDVELNGQTGFDLIHQLMGIPVKPAVIFVTGYEKYAIEAIRHAAFDYLLKPIDPFELKKALERYKDSPPAIWNNQVDALNESLNSQKKLVLNVRSGILYLDPLEILYCEADGNYTIVVTGKARKECITQQIGQMEKRLDSTNFIRLGRSLLINRKYISLIDRTKRQVILNKAGDTAVLNVTQKQIRELGSLLKT